MFGSKFQARHAQRFMRVAHIASDFTCDYCDPPAGTIFETTWDIFGQKFWKSEKTPKMEKTATDQLILGVNLYIYISMMKIC